MFQPDNYGSYQGSMVPEGIIKPGTSLVSKKDLEQQRNSALNALDQTTVDYSGLGENRKKAEQLVANMNTIETSKTPDAQFDFNSLISGASNIASGAKENAGAGLITKTGEFAKGATGIMGGVGAIGGAAGNYLSQAGHHTAGSTVSGLTKGISTGMMFGPLGAAVGGAFGALYGFGQGKATSAAVKKAKADEEEFVKDYNEKVTKKKSQILGQADDADSWAELQANAKKLEQYGKRKNTYNMRYMGGGLLRYKPEIIEEKPEEKETGKLEDVPMYRGGGVMDVSNKDKKTKKKKVVLERGAYAMQAPTFKKGGKVSKCKKGCPCDPCKKKAKHARQAQLTMIFRRGGKVHLSKENVIIDGPSHDEFNNTGIKGDKGLPVGKMNDGGEIEKIAEIESGELVINALSSKEIEALRERVKKGDKQAVAMLGELLQKELGHNTFDYSNLMD